MLNVCDLCMCVVCVLCDVLCGVCVISVSASCLYCLVRPSLTPIRVLNASLSAMVLENHWSM